MQYITVAGAYGKDYASQKEAKAAWEAGKDFIILDAMHPYYGKPINKQDAEGSEEQITAINIRFNQLRKIAVVKVKQGRK